MTDGGTYSVKKLNSSFSAECAPARHSPDEMICEQSGTFTFRFNPNTRRFLFAHYEGYVNGDDQPETPYTEIGVCLRLE